MTTQNSMFLTQLAKTLMLKICYFYLLKASKSSKWFQPEICMTYLYTNVEKITGWNYVWDGERDPLTVSNSFTNTIFPGEKRKRIAVTLLLTLFFSFPLSTQREIINNNHLLLLLCMHSHTPTHTHTIAFILLTLTPDRKAHNAKFSVSY